MCPVGFPEFLLGVGAGLFVLAGACVIAYLVRLLRNMDGGN